MAKRILVPIEGGARDTEALTMAGHLARQFSARVELLYVAPALFDTRDLVAAEQRLDQYAQQLRADGVETHFHVEYGAPAPGIAEVAQRSAAELIVLTPERRAMLESLWHPRVSRELLGRATTPLLILPDVPPDASGEQAELLGDPLAKVLLALDGSANAEAALPMATMLAQTYQRPVTLVRVVEPIFILGAGVEAREAQREAMYAEKLAAHQYLVEARKRLEAETQLDVETIELVGPIAEHLTRLGAAFPGSVLVMGTHGRGGLARVVVGSVAAGVMARARTPVIIVPSRPAQQSDNPAR
jgi:nucleotide-binding universal stress UspA family protein